MNEEEIQEYSEVVKEKARRESDRLKDLKRKIEDEKTIRNQLEPEEHELLLTALQSEVQNLEKTASNAEKIIREKID